jgi:hypothetical protein
MTPTPRILSQPVLSLVMGGKWATLKWTCSMELAIYDHLGVNRFSVAHSAFLMSRGSGGGCFDFERAGEAEKKPE